MTDNPPIKIYVNKIENWITFETKTGNYLELLMPETIKLLEIPKIKLLKMKIEKCTTFRNYWSSISPF